MRRSLKWFAGMGILAVGTAVALAAYPVGYGTNGGVLSSNTPGLGGPYSPETGSPPKIEYPVGSNQWWFRESVANESPVKFQRTSAGGVFTLMITGNQYWITNDPPGSPGPQQVDSGGATANPPAK